MVKQYITFFYYKTFLENYTIMELTSNNISTIAVFLYTIISPILATYGVSIDQGTFTSLIIGITGLIIAIWSSRNPNTIKALGNNNTDESC